MRRSSGTIVSVKVPINWERMTKRQRTRLSHITGRDTRVIRAYLGVIERHQKQLVKGDKWKRIDIVQLDRLTLTALRHKDPKRRRLEVPHDFKARFPNISVNELQECRDVAVNMWTSYLRKGGSPPLHMEGKRKRKIPRNIFPKLFQLVYRPDLTIKHWLEIRDSLDSVRQGRRVHDKLTVPLKVSPFHLSQIERGTMNSCKIVKDDECRWWVVFSIGINESKKSFQKERPLAVVGIDLGISKAACAVTLTKDRVQHVRYFYQKEKIEYLKRCEQRISSLQRDMRIRREQRLPYDKLAKKLRILRHKQANINEEWDRVLVANLIDYVTELSQKYNLYVAVGNPKGIRNIASKQYSCGRKYRKMIHRWAFFRVIQKLEHHFSQLGWSVGRFESRFLAVYEGRTSITCSQCGRRGTRPKQDLFVCPTCGYRTNADRNGAINIAIRRIKLTPALQDELKGLGRWLHASKQKPRPKAARKTAEVSKQKSSLPQRSPALLEGESATVHHVQQDLLILGDKGKMSDKDPVVESAAESPPAVGHLDSPRSGGSDVLEQRKEATFRQMDHVQMKSDKARVNQERVNGPESSDGCHGSGGTQRLQKDCEVHSTSHNP